MNKFFGHLKTVRTHRKWVRYYCFKSHLYWQGLTHDLSKYSPIEFFESVKYYQGNRSPIDACKEEKGISKAWLHHRSKNKHHREYWVDNFDKGTAAIQMPYKYAVEMLCDFLGAYRAYNGDNFIYECEYKWWQDKLKSGIKVHPQTIFFIRYALNYLICDEEWTFKNLRILYDEAEKLSIGHGFRNIYYGDSRDVLNINCQENTPVRKENEYSWEL